MPATRTHSVKIRVGEWTDDKGQTHGRYRTIGSGFTDEDGRSFLRIHVEAFNPGLAALARKKGQDTILLNLWSENDDERRPVSSTAAAAEDDDIPF